MSITISVRTPEGGRALVVSLDVTTGDNGGIRDEQKQTISVIVNADAARSRDREKKFFQVPICIR